MTGGLLLASVARPAVVHGPHAGEQVGWACLARKFGLTGPWEAVEWFCLPPGGDTGAPRRSRTRRLWFGLTGTARLELDGRPYSLTRDRLGLGRPGGTHTVHNVGTTQAQWLVVDVGGQAAPGRAAAPRVGETMNDLVDLAEVGEFDPRTVFDGPLDSVRLRRLGPGAALGLVADEREHTVFVLAGSGECVTEHLRVPIREGSSITLPLDGAMRLAAGEAGLELFHATMLVRGECR